MKRPSTRASRIAAASSALAIFLVGAAAYAAPPTVPECLAASESAITLGKQHHLQAAKAALLVCASSTCPADIQKECAARVSATDAAVPTIVFGAKNPLGDDLSAVRVTMDGALITDRLDGTAIPLDPGAHVFTFEAAGQPLLRKEIVAREGEKGRREIVELGVKLAARPTVIEAPVSAPVTAPSPMPRRRVAALAVGAIGVVGLGLGAAFGGIAVDVHNEAKTACPTSRCPTQHGVDLWNASHLDGNISTASLVIGGVALAAGLTVWFTTPRTQAPRTGLTLAPGSIAYKGTF